MEHNRVGKTLLLGAITGYSIADIQPYLNSLDDSGFDGYRGMIVVNGDESLLHALHHEYNFSVMNYKPQNDLPFNICVLRFYLYWKFLREMQNTDIDYVVATDVRDVVFQRNIDEYLNFQDYHNPDLILSGEGLQYEDEPWGKANMFRSFGPDVYDMMKDKLIINAGVMAGNLMTMEPLFLDIWNYCRGLPAFIDGGGGPDQAAYNILLQTAYSTYNTLYTDGDDWFACQTGTTFDPSKMSVFENKLFCAKPCFNNDEFLMENAEGQPFCIVHQWDRNPELKKYFGEIYG